MAFALSSCYPVSIFFLSSSNCVVNLTPDKEAVLKEAYRVLKVITCVLPPEAYQTVGLKWLSNCLSLDIIC